MLEVFKFVVKQLVPYKWRVIFLSSLSLIAAGIGASIPYLYGVTVDQAIEQAPLTSLLSLVGFWLLLSLFEGYLRRFLFEKGAVIADKVALNISKEALLRFLRFPISFHQDKKSHELATKVDSLRWDVQYVITDLVFDTGPAIITSLVILFVVFSINWLIGVVLVITIIFFFASSYKTAESEVKARDKYNEAHTTALGSIWDALENIFIVKSNQGEREETRLMNRNVNRVEKYSKAYERVSRKRQAYQNTIITIGMFAAFAISLVNVRNGTMTPGQLTAVLGYVFAIEGYVRFSAWAFRFVSKLQSTFKILEKVKQQPEERYDGGKSIDIFGNISFQNVKFAYEDGRPILRGLSFEIKEGERVALVGESGQGKTTIIQLLGNYLVPTSGKILVEDMPVEEVALKSLRAHMAYVPQDLTLFHTSLEHNILYGAPKGSKKRLQKVLQQSQLADLVQRLPKGLKTVVGERGLKLSAGERQRVAIARAMLRDPNVLILDEPTSNLDARTERKIQEALDELMEGRTTIVIAHRLRTIKSVDRVLVLDGGKIVERGSFKELSKKTRGAFKALLELQNEG